MVEQDKVLLDRAISGRTRQMQLKVLQRCYTIHDQTMTVVETGPHNLCSITQQAVKQCTVQAVMMPLLPLGSCWAQPIRRRQ